jgi:hypothetical protein
LIPVLLMLAYPHGYPCPGPVQAARLRASDADRDTTVDILCAAVGDGRLTLAELDERVGTALSARTVAQLAGLIADLPGRSRGRAGRPPADPAARSAAPTLSRWSHIEALIDTRAGRLSSRPT